MSMQMWMVRAGESGFLFDDFEANSVVAVGWSLLLNATKLQTREDFVNAVQEKYNYSKKGQLASSAGQIYRFVREMAKGDYVISYKTQERIYIVGQIQSDCLYAPEIISADYPHVRKIKWIGTIDRDNLSVSSRNGLGSISALFLLSEDVANEVSALLRKASSMTDNKAQHGVQDTHQNIDLTKETNNEEVGILYKDVQSRGFEFIKDKINTLDWDDMQELVAGLLRAMGYKTRISPSGSDRGKDIVASPDGFGFEDPRIVVEVKHRNNAMTSQEIRSFIGGRHEADKGLYVSTGGFTKDARYEAERARIPLTLMDLDDLVKALLERYEDMDVEMQALIPLRKIYWPA